MYELTLFGTECLAVVVVLAAVFDDRLAHVIVLILSDLLNHTFVNLQQIRKNVITSDENTVITKFSFPYRRFEI